MTPQILNPPPVKVEVVGEIAPRQVIAVRGDGFADAADAALAIFDHYREALGADIPHDAPAAEYLPLVVHLPDPADSIELLDEDEMRAHGWVRAEPETDA